MARVAPRTRLDVGKALMVPLAALILLADLRTLARTAAQVSHGAAGALRFGGTILACAFFALLIVGYLRRGPPVATHHSRAARVVAVVATFLPFPFPLLHGAPPGAAQQLAADALLLAGTAWSVWSLWALGRNISLIAQARGLADRGPYRLMRHPLYTGELTAALGLAVMAGTAAAFAVWLVLCSMQVYRALSEEQVLRSALPEYEEYRSRTAAFLPRLF
jgi:protein-S-isoprenylcysteine O-methyltransferase Ste14